ncbi:hypothetical protein ACQ4PT_025181 [Festuca glaucescens]
MEGRSRALRAAAADLVGETSSVRKRKFDEVDDSEDSSHSYVSSDIESGDAVSYNSASSDASSKAEVTKYNELSYEKRVEEKIWEEGVSAYLNTAGKYYCKFHPFKQVPRDGMREGLVAHAKTVKPKDRRDTANHAALIKVNMDAHVAQVGAPRDAQKRVTIRGPGILGNADFDSYVFPNLVEMDDEQLARVKRVVRKHKPSKPLYVFTIKKSNIIKGKAKMYFSKAYTMDHILKNLELPAEIQVFSRNTKVAKVRMVLSKEKVKGKVIGKSAMITSKWMDVVKQNDMQVGDIYIFWFRGSKEGGLKLLVDQL